MSGVLLDTHAFAWTLYGENDLSEIARREIGSASGVFVSAISFYEIAQKVRLGKWPDMLPFVDRLALLANQQGIDVAALDASISLRAGGLRWAHRDPFDRMLAATALDLGLTLISIDRAFDGIVARIW